MRAQRQRLGKHAGHISDSSRLTVARLVEEHHIPIFSSAFLFVERSPRDDTVTRRVTPVAVCAESTTRKLRLPTNETALHAPFAHLPWVQRPSRRILPHHVSTSNTLTEFVSPCPRKRVHHTNFQPLKDVSILWWAKRQKHFCSFFFC